MDASILTDLAHDPFVQTGVLAIASGVGRGDDAQDLSQREILVAEGAQLRSLAIIRTRVAVVSCHEEGELELRRLAPRAISAKAVCSPALAEWQWSALGPSLSSTKSARPHWPS